MTFVKGKRQRPEKNRQSHDPRFGQSFALSLGGYVFIESLSTPALAAFLLHHKCRILPHPPLAPRQSSRLRLTPSRPPKAQKPKCPKARNPLHLHRNPTARRLHRPPLSIWLQNILKHPGAPALPALQTALKHIVGRRLSSNQAREGIGTQPLRSTATQSIPRSWDLDGCCCAIRKHSATECAQGTRAYFKRLRQPLFLPSPIVLLRLELHSRLESVPEGHNIHNQILSNQQTARNQDQY